MALKSLAPAVALPSSGLVEGMVSGDLVDNQVWFLSGVLGGVEEKRDALVLKITQLAPCTPKVRHERAL